jgi:probable rRNA maturation factor
MQQVISISVNDEFQDAVDVEHLRKLAHSVLEAEGVTSPYEVSLVLTDSSTIRELNRDYRGLDEATDVLAFQMLSRKDPDESFVHPPDGITRLGEVIISYPKALEQAKEQGHTTERELALLVIHGILHLLDYDHEDSGEEAGMRAREEEHLQRYLC